MSCLSTYKVLIRLLVTHFTEVLLTSFISVAFFFHLFNLSRFFGFTRLSKKQLCFTSSFSFLPGAISRISGRDPLLVWESCDARDRRPRRFQKLPEASRCSGLSVCPFCACVLFFCIASCHHAFMSFYFASQPK